jgi:radial spoke head protein 1
MDSYDGNFVEGKRTGYGVYTYANGDKYEGDWIDNQKDGIGKLFYTETGEYFGRFENGKRHGEGVFTYKKNKDVFSGSWKYGKKHGKGTYIFNDTKMKVIIYLNKIVGEWIDGKVETGRWIFPNGTYFEGRFDKNKPVGEGIWHFSNGNTVKGLFNQNQTEDDEGNTLTKIKWTTDAEVTDPTRLIEIN